MKNKLLIFAFAIAALIVDLAVLKFLQRDNSANVTRPYTLKAAYWVGNYREGVDSECIIHLRGNLQFDIASCPSYYIGERAGRSVNLVGMWQTGDDGDGSFALHFNVDTIGGNKKQYKFFMRAGDHNLYWEISDGTTYQFLRMK